MIFSITLTKISGNTLPVNYAYPLSAAIYRILAKGDAAYASFLHHTGYGKGFKLFTFSQINGTFNIQGDRMRLLGDEVRFQVAFHLPEAMERFVKGLFQSERIDIADKISKVSFTVKSVESLPNPLQNYKQNEIVHVSLKPLSPIVAGLPNDKGNYDFLSPDDPRFTDCLIYNWRSKIAACYDGNGVVASAKFHIENSDLAGLSNSLLLMEVLPMTKPYKSRLITIKADTPEETKIRGWMNFGLKVTGERRFVELLMNVGVGVYNSMGMGCVGVLD